MSTKKGNNSKKGQKYQNTKAFKNNLHDTSKKMKQINSLKVGGVCARCREIIEWRKKFKKYKPLTAPKKCVRCQQKTIKHAYHTVCSECAQQAGVCEKCGEVQEITAKSEPTPAERASEDFMLCQEMKSMTQRQRWTFFRHLEEVDRGDSKQVACSSNTSDLSSNEDDDVEMSEPDEPVDSEKLES